MDKSGRMQVEKFKSRYTCNICGNALATERNLKRHLDKLHFEVTCNVCGKVFLSRQELEYHKLSHRETPVERPARQVQILDSDHVIFESHPDLEVPLTQSAEVFTSTLHLIKPEQDSLRPVKPVVKESEGETSTQPESEEDKFESVIVVAEPNLEIQGHQTIFLLSDESEIPHDNQELQKAVREFMALQTDINLDGAQIHFEINSQTTNSDVDYVENQDVQIEDESLKNTKVSMEENSADQAIRELLSGWEPGSNIMDLATQGSLTNPVDTTVKNLINLTVDSVKETLTEQTPLAIENFPDENRTSETPLDLSIGNLSNDKNQMENSYTLSIPEDLANLSIIENSDVCVIRDNPEADQIILRTDDSEGQFENQTVYHLYPEEGTIEDEIKVQSTDKSEFHEDDNNQTISIPYHDPETFSQHPEQFSDLSHATLEKTGKQTPPVFVEYRPIVRKKFNEKPKSASIKKASNSSKAFLTLKGDKSVKKNKSPTETRIKRCKPIKKLLIEKIKTDLPPKGKKCCVCDQSFPTLKELHAHEDTHLTENLKYVYTCKVCRKSFETLSLLYSHMKKHPEEKPFQCPTCDKKCRQSSELYIHQMSHEKNKHFRCEYCRNSYSRPHNLSRHRYAIHNVNGECLISDSFTLKEWKEYTKRLRQKSARRFRSTVVIDDAGSNHPSYEKEEALNDSDDGYTNTLDSEYVSDSSETDSWLNADLKDQSDLQKGKLDSYDELFTSSNVSEEDSRPSIDLSVESISSSEDPVKPHMQDLELIEKQEEELKKLDAELDVDLASLGINNTGSGNSSDQDQTEIIKKPAVKRINSVKCRKRYSPTSLMDILEESAKEIFVNIAQGIDMTNTIPVNKPQTVVKKSKPKPKVQGPEYDSPLEDNDCLMEVLEQSARVIFKENVITPKNKKDSQFNEDPTDEKVDSKVVEKEDSHPQLAQISPLNSPRKDSDKYFVSQRGSSRKMAQRPRRRVCNRDESSNSSSIEDNRQAEPKSLKKINKPITTKETKPPSESRLGFSDWLDTLGATKPHTARKSFPKISPVQNPKLSTAKSIDNTNSITIAPDLDKFKHQEWVDVICGVGSQRAKKSFPRARLPNTNSISKKSNRDEVFNTVKKIASHRGLTVVQGDGSTSVVKCNSTTIRKDMYKEGPRTLQFGSSTINYFPPKEVIDKSEQHSKELAKITLGEKLIKNIVKPPCPTTEVNTPDMSIVVTSGLIEPSSTPNLIENIKCNSKRIQSINSPSLVKENPKEPNNTDLTTYTSQNKGGDLISILNPKSKVASKTNKPLQAVVPTIKVNPKSIPEQSVISKKFNSFGQEDADVIKIKPPALKAKQTARKSFPSSSRPKDEFPYTSSKPSKISTPALNKISPTKMSSKTFLDQYLAIVNRNSVPQTSAQLELGSHSRKDTSVSESDKEFSDWNMDDIDTDSSDELYLHPGRTSKNKSKNLNKKARLSIGEGNELLEPSAIFNSPSTFIVQTPDMPLEENVPSISSQEDIVYRTLISSSNMELNVSDGKTQSSVGSEDPLDPAISSKKSGSKIFFNSDKSRKPGSETVVKFQTSDCENLPAADSSQNETFKTASIDSEPTLLLNTELMNIVNFLNPPKSPTETELRQSPDKDKDSIKTSTKIAENINTPQSKRIGPKTRNTTKTESSASSETPTTSGGMSKSTKSDGKTFASGKSDRKSITPTKSDRKHTSMSNKSDEKSFITTKLGKKPGAVSKTSRDSVESEKIMTTIVTRRSGRLVNIENDTEGSLIGTVTPTTRAIKTAKASRSKKLLSNSEIETALFNEDLSPTATDPTKKKRLTRDDVPTNLTSSGHKISSSKREKQKSAESVLSKKSSKAVTPSNPVGKTKTTKSATKTRLKSIEKTSEAMEKSIELGSVEKSLDTTEHVGETVELSVVKSVKPVEPDQALDISMELAKIPRKSVESDQALLERVESAKEKVYESIESSQALGESIESSQALGESIESSQALGESIESSQALGESIESSEALGESIESSEALGESIESSEALGESIESSQALGESIESSQALGESIESSQALGESIESSEAFAESIESSRNLSQSKESAETICEAIVSAEALCESIESTEALHQSVESTEAHGESNLSTEALEKPLEPENEYTLAFDEYVQPQLANNESVDLSLAHTPSFEEEKNILDDIEPEDVIKYSTGPEEVVKYSEETLSNCIIEVNKNVQGSIEPEKGLIDSIEPEKGLIDSIEPENGLVDSIEPEKGLVDSIEPEKGLVDSVEPEKGLVDSIEPEKGLVDSIEPEKGLVDSSEPEKGLVGSIEPEKGLVDSIEPENYPVNSVEPESYPVDSVEPENYPVDSVEPEETLVDTIEPEKALADYIELEEILVVSIERENYLEHSVELEETLVDSIEPENNPEDSLEQEETLVDSIDPEKGISVSVELKGTLVDSIEPEEGLADSFEQEKGLADSVELEETLVDSMEPENCLADSIELEHSLVDSIEPQKDPEDYIEPEETLIDTNETEKGLTDSVELENTVNNSIEQEKRLVDSTEPEETLVDPIKPENDPEDSIEPEETLVDMIEPGKSLADSMEPGKSLADSMEPEETLVDTMEPENYLADSIELEHSLVDTIEQEKDPEDFIEPEETLIDNKETEKGIADSIELEHSLVDSIEPEKDPEDSIEPEKDPEDSIEPEKDPEDSIEPEKDPEDSIEPEKDPEDSIEPEKDPEDSIEPEKDPEDSIEPEKDPEDSIEPEQDPEDSIEPEKDPEDSIEPEKDPENSIEPEKDPENSIEPEKDPENSIEPEKDAEDSIEPEEVLDDFINPEEEVTNFTDPNKTKDYIDPQKVLVGSTEPEKTPAEFIRPEETVSDSIQPVKDIATSLEKAPPDCVASEKVLRDCMMLGKASSNCRSLEKVPTDCTSLEETLTDCMMPEMSLEVPIRPEHVNEGSIFEFDVTLKEAATPVKPAQPATAYDGSIEPIHVIEGISECSQPINKSIDVFDSLQQTEVDMCQNSTYPVRYVEPSKIGYSLEHEEDSSGSDQDTSKPDKYLEVSTKSLETLKPVETVNQLGSKEASESRNFSKGRHHLSKELRDIMEESQVYKSPSNEDVLYVSATGRYLRKAAQRKLIDSDIMAKTIKTVETGASSSNPGRTYAKQNIGTEVKSSTIVSTSKEDNPLDSEKKSNSEIRKGRRLSKKALENQVKTDETDDSSSKPRRKRGRPPSMKKNSEIELNSSNIVSRSNDNENTTVADKRGAPKTKKSKLRSVTQKTIESQTETSIVVSDEVAVTKDVSVTSENIESVPIKPLLQMTLESQVESTDVEKSSLHVEPSIVDSKTDIESAAERVTKPKPLSKKTKDGVIKLLTESQSESSDIGASRLRVEPPSIHVELTSHQVETHTTVESSPKSKTNKPKPLSKKIKGSQLESPEVEEPSLPHEPTTVVTTKTALESSTKPICNRPKPLSKKTKVSQHVSTSVEETDLQDKLPAHVTTEMTLLSSAKPITYRPKPFSKKTKGSQLEYSNVEANLLTNVTTETTLLSGAKPKPLSKKRSEVEAPYLDAISQNFIETNSSINNDPLIDTMSSEPGTSRTKPITRKTLNNRNTRGLAKKRFLTEESMEEIDVESSADFNRVHDYLDKRKNRKINFVNRTQAAVLKSKLKRSAKFVVHKGFTIVPLRPTFDLRPSKNRKLRTPENRFNVTDMRTTAQHFDSQEEKIRKPKSGILKKRGQSFQLVSSPRKKKRVDFTSSSQPDTSDSELSSASVNEFESASTTKLPKRKTSPVKAKNKKSNKKIISTSKEHNYHTRRRRNNMPMPNLSPIDDKSTGIKKFADALRLTSLKQLQANETSSSATFCEANINELSVPTTETSENVIITKSDANKITVLSPISNKSSSVLGSSYKDATARSILTEFPTASCSYSVESKSTFTSSDENNLPVTPNPSVNKSSKEKFTQIQNLARKTFPFSSSLSLNESSPVLSPNLNLPSTASTSQDSPPVLSPGPSSPLISSFLNSSLVPKCFFNSTTSKSDIDHYDLKSVYLMVKDPLSKVDYQVPVESCLKSFNKLCVNLGNSILPSENIKPAYRNGRRVNN